MVRLTLLFFLEREVYSVAKSRNYLPEEVKGILHTLQPMLRDRRMFLLIANDVKLAHPWLVPLIEALEDQTNFIDVSEHGFARVSMTPDNNILLVHLPEECVWHDKKDLWGAHIPYYFRFELTQGGRYKLVEIKTPYETSNQKKLSKEGRLR